MGMMLLGRSSGSSDDVPGNAAMRDPTRGSPDIERAGDMRARVPIVVFVAMDGGVTNVGIARVSTWSGEVRSTRDELTFYFLDEA